MRGIITTYIINKGSNLAALLVTVARVARAFALPLSRHFTR